MPRIFLETISNAIEAKIKQSIRANKGGKSSGIKKNCLFLITFGEVFNPLLFIHQLIQFICQLGI